MAQLLKRTYCRGFPMNDNKIIKSPLNYIGGKHKLLPQILPLLPRDINTFVDLFGGGFNVGINIECNHLIYNDIVHQISELMNTMAEKSEEDILQHISTRIKEFDLSKTNSDGYYQFRESYNKRPNPLDLYVLICFSFNHQVRFNSSMHYNNPFGKNRSSFTKTLENKLKMFLRELKKKNVTFQSRDFIDFDFDSLTSKDLVYCDPPYLITTASYNDGKRGFKGWNEELELNLLKKLDELNRRGVNFALSNVIKHKGKINHHLEAWSKNYNVHALNYDYNNSNYQSKNLDLDSTSEVLITNFGSMR